MTVTFKAKQPDDSWIGSVLVKWFGASWMIEAWVEHVAVRQRGLTDAALKDELLAPTNSNSCWSWNAIADYFAELGAMLRGQGIVFNERACAPGAAGTPPCRAPLEGMEDFATLEQGASFAVVRAQQSPGGRSNGAAVYRRHEAKMSADNRVLRQVVVTRDGKPVGTSQQVGDAKRDKAVTAQGQETGTNIGSRDYLVCRQARALKYQRRVPASSFLYADQFIRRETRVSLDSVFEQLRKDIRRTLLSDRNYLKLDGRSPVDVGFFEADEALSAWVSRERRVGLKDRYAISEVPGELTRRLAALNVPISTSTSQGQSTMTPGEILEALREKAHQALIEKFTQTFTDVDMLRHMFNALTQHFDLATMAVVTAEGGGVRNSVFKAGLRFTRMAGRNDPRKG
ncbi:hypothetical protein [Pandoraea oxalativorans]|uniref:hypothetical protein n=1 Tax=Pandoraea oxalativorans TaxID=573737 RepID=UPI000ADE75C5|nr:hypothetical protein [Pandoraea oxalativorans]